MPALYEGRMSLKDDCSSECKALSFISRILVLNGNCVLEWNPPLLMETARIDGYSLDKCRIDEGKPSRLSERKVS